MVPESLKNERGQQRFSSTSGKHQRVPPETQQPSSPVLHHCRNTRMQEWPSRGPSTSRCATSSPATLRKKKKKTCDGLLFDAIRIPSLFAPPEADCSPPWPIDVDGRYIESRVKFLSDRRLPGFAPPAPTARPTRGARGQALRGLFLRPLEPSSNRADQPTTTLPSKWRRSSPCFVPFVLRKHNQSAQVDQRKGSGMVVGPPPPARKRV